MASYNYNLNTHRELRRFRKEVSIFSEDKVRGQFWVTRIKDDVPCKKKRVNLLRVHFNRVLTQP